VAEAGNPIAWNRYAYVYDNPVNLTDSSGHFVDTLLDVLDLATNVQGCLGDSDTLSCYMVPVSAAFVAIPFLSGGGMESRAAKAARGAEVEGILGPEGPGQFVMPKSEFSQILEEQGEEAAMKYVQKQHSYLKIPDTVESISYDPNLETFGRTKHLGSGRTAITLGPQAFSSEGQTASTLGHELIHARQRVEEATGIHVYEPFEVEVPAYGWEIENAGRTGVTREEFDAIFQQWKQFRGLWRRHNELN
jgi:hypothetical protein